MLYSTKTTMKYPSWTTRCDLSIIERFLNAKLCCHGSRPSSTNPVMFYRVMVLTITTTRFRLGTEVSKKYCKCYCIQYSKDTIRQEISIFLMCCRAYIELCHDNFTITII